MKMPALVTLRAAEEIAAADGNVAEAVAAVYRRLNEPHTLGERNFLKAVYRALCRQGGVGAPAAVTDSIDIAAIGRALVALAAQDPLDVARLGDLLKRLALIYGRADTAKERRL